MLKMFAAATMLALGMVGSPAAAGTYDAFTSFNGSQGSAHFTYGGYTAGVFTPFTSNSGCASLISGAICLHDASLPGAFKTTTGPHQSGTVIVPGDRLILHPGAGDSAAYVMFTSVSANSYDLSAIFSVQDNNPTGVLVSYFTIIGGVLDVTFQSAVSANDMGFFDAQTQVLAAGDKFGFIIDKDGLYNNDSTGVGFTVTSVPEPATWGLMIAGFGLTGLAMRRRSVARAA